MEEHEASEQEVKYYRLSEVEERNTSKNMRNLDTLLQFLSHCTEDRHKIAKPPMSSSLGSSQSECVRLSKSLNKGENAYVEERKVKIEKCLEQNGINFKARVPHIAVLGSGGGERAMVGMLGCLDQMAQDNLLNSALYLCGVSGSTWCMSMLYEDPAWSSNLHSLKPKLIKRLTETTIDFSKIIGWLTEAIKYDNYSLTDFWAATVTYNVVKEMDSSHLSGQKQRDATNPYPIYTVIDKGLKLDGQTADCWFELSPHEAGYSHVGAFVDTSAFGSQFEAGVLTQNVDKRDILYLQGLCTSSLAEWGQDKENMLQMIWDRIKHLFHHGRIPHNELSLGKRGPHDHHACKVIDTLLKLHNNLENDSLLKELRQFVSVVSSTDLSNAFPSEEVWKEMSAEERNKCFAVLATDICNSLSSSFSDLGNDGEVPDMLLSDQCRYLEDAGLLLNSAYVAALRPAREVDLILSFDFSEGDPFLTVTQAADYCKEAGIPFPSVSVPEEERENPKQLYVFKSKDGPTVIHIPLFNIVSCEGDVEKWRKKYPTFMSAYNRHAIEDLLRLSSLNVSNNKKRILEEIQAAC